MTRLQLVPGGSPPVFAIVGQSNVGKTTLLTALIGLLGDRGYRVGAVKHAAHGLALDQPGKDTWHMARAGAASVILASDSGLAVTEPDDRPWSPQEPAGPFGDRVDLVLVEGFKRAGVPKVEVWRAALPQAPLLPRWRSPRS